MAIIGGIPYFQTYPNITPCFDSWGKNPTFKDRWMDSFSFASFVQTSGGTAKSSGVLVDPHVEPLDVWDPTNKFCQIWKLEFLTRYHQQNQGKSTSVYMSCVYYRWTLGCLMVPHKSAATRLNASCRSMLSIMQTFGLLLRCSAVAIAPFQMVSNIRIH